MTDTARHDEAAGTDEGAAEDPATARRSLLTKGGAAAAVAAVAGLGLSRTAQAADNDPVLVGKSEDGTSTTELTGGTTFRVTNGTSDANASVYGFQDGSDADGHYGVRGSHGAVSGGTGVYGTASGSNGMGVHGRSINYLAVGVYGEHASDTQPGTGVTGVSENGAGVVGRGTSTDVEAGQSGRIRASAVGQSGSPSDTGSPGTIARDTDGNLWYCHTSDQWQRLGGPAAGGAFHPIDPVRVFDSRQGAYAESGRLDPNGSKTISVADGRDAAGSVTSTDAIPDGATAIAYNVTVTGTTGPNFVSVTPGDAAGYTTSTINWTGTGESLANGAIVKLDDMRQVTLFGGDQSGSADVIVDVTGYFL